MKRDLSDITFIIPFHFDSEERLANAMYIINFLDSNFKTKILLLEAGTNRSFPSDIPCEYEMLDDATGFHYHGAVKIFFRTRVLNYGIKKSTTRFVAIYDTDVFFNVQQYTKSAEILRSAEAPVLLYPYDGKWLELNRSFLSDGVIRPKTSYGVGSLGGACFLDREKYKELGMESERIIGWGYDDVYRHHIMVKLGLKVCRVPGDLYHLEHPRGINSGTGNPLWRPGEDEFKRIKEMTPDEFMEYIKTYEWTKA